MNAQCTKCRMTLELSWTFCPKCGLAVPQETHSHAEHAGHEKSSMPGAFGGLLFGVIAAPILLIVGIMLCLTGLGAFLGVPLIIAAIFAPLAGPLFGMGEHKVRCPSCKTRMITIADSRMHYCPACEKEFAVGEHQLVKAS